MSYLELSQLRGLGQASDETPELKVLPWKIDTVGPKAPTAAEKRWETIEKVGTLAGVLATVFGLVLTARAIRKGGSR